MATVSHLGNFPFCVQEAEQWDGSTFVDYFGLRIPSQNSSSYVPVCGAGTTYPVAMSLQDACTFYWRVKRWRVQCNLSLETTYFDCNDEEECEYLPLSYFSSVNATGGLFVFDYDENGNPIVGPSYDERNEQYYDDLFAKEKENSRVCKIAVSEYGTALSFQTYSAETRSNKYITYSVEQQPSGVSGATYSLMFSTFSSIFDSTSVPPTPKIVKEKDTDNYYPYISIVNDIVGGNYGFVMFSNYKREDGQSYNGYDASLLGVETITITCAEKTFELPVFIYGGTNNPETSVNYSLQASVEGFEYFPYDPNDGGGPIYDEDTGEQIR
jgi:hypothetical protein